MNGPQYRALANLSRLVRHSSNLYPMNATHNLLCTHLRQRVADTFGTALTYPREAKALAAVLRRAAPASASYPAP